MDAQTQDIVRVTLRSGMIEALKKIDQCPQITFTAPDIPTDILEQLLIQNTEETRRAHRITNAVEKYMREDRMGNT